MPKLPRRLRYGDEATLVEHLDELRSRIIVVLIALAVCMGVAYAFHERLIHWLEVPLPPEHRHLITLSPTEPFMTSLTVSLYAALILALPISMWQLWEFLAPAVDEKSQRTVVVLIAFAALLAAGGLAFGYFVVLPGAIHFLTNYDSNLYSIQIRARDYLSFSSSVLLAIVAMFEVPVVVIGLVRMGVLTSRVLRRNRRWGYLIVAVLALALPGPDPVTTAFELLPMWAIYELSIWLAVLTERRIRVADSAASTAGT